MAVSVWASFMASWFTPGSLFLFLNLTIGTIFLLTRFGTKNNPAHHDSHQLARASSLLYRVKSINFSLYKFDAPELLHHHHHQPEPENPPRIERTPSLLERLKTINFSLYKFDPPELHNHHHHLPETENQPRIERTPSLLERLKSINLSTIYYNSSSSRPDHESEPEANHRDPSPEPVQDRGVKRSRSESAGERSALVEKMTKSASEKPGRGGFAGGEEEEEEEEEEEVEGEKEEIAVMERRRPATARENSVKETETSAFSEDDGVDAKADDFINRFKQQLRLQRMESLKRFSEMWKGK